MAAQGGVALVASGGREVSAGTDVQHEIAPETAPVVHHRSTLNWWLAGGLVVALLAVIGLGAWVYNDHHQTTTGLTTTQAAAVAAVDASLAAQNANDCTALANSLTSDATWMAVGGGAIGVGPIVGRQAYVDMIKSEGGATFTKLADPVVASDTVVAVPMNVSISGAGVCVFTVRNDGGTVKVSEMVWIPEVNSR